MANTTVTDEEGRVGGGGCMSYETEVEKRLLSFINFIVDSKTFLLSARSRDGCPYKYNFGWFPRWFKLFLCKILMMLTTKATTCVV